MPPLHRYPTTYHLFTDCSLCLRVHYGLAPSNHPVPCYLYFYTSVFKASQQFPEMFTLPVSAFWNSARVPSSPNRSTLQRNTFLCFLLSTFLVRSVFAHMRNWSVEPTVYLSHLLHLWDLCDPSIYQDVVDHRVLVAKCPLPGELRLIAFPSTV